MYEEIPYEDLSISIYPERKGLGGQVCGYIGNGVRIEHIPTKTIAICEAHRSQHKNKETAYNMILYALSDLGYIYK